MRTERSMKTTTKIVTQIEELALLGVTIQIERSGAEYEVTVFDPWPREDGQKNHSHHGGKTLAEAVNRAAQCLLVQEAKKESAGS